MFDKNFFKDAFRSWALAHLDATDDDVLAFCQSSIPAQHFARNLWLVEQSLQWFKWCRSQQKPASITADEDYADNETLM